MNLVVFSIIANTFVVSGWNWENGEELLGIIWQIAIQGRKRSLHRFQKKGILYHFEE